MNAVMGFFSQVCCKLADSRFKASRRKSSSRPTVGISKYLFLLVVLLFSGNIYAASPNDSSSCGGHGQTVCPWPAYAPSCDTNHFDKNLAGTCYSSDPNSYSNCGGNGQTICAWPIFPTCDSTLVQDGTSCIDTNPNNNSGCGGAGQSICSLPIFPTCDSKLVQDGSTCVDTNPNYNSGCGGAEQSICEWPIFPTCDTDRVQDGNFCRDTNPNNHSSCGGSTQSICELPIFPTCDTSLAQRLSDDTCHSTDPNLVSTCGGIGQSICQLPTFPTCDTNRVQDGTLCQDKNPNNHSGCGDAGQVICEWPIFPTCDTNRVQDGSFCRDTNPNNHTSCGGTGQSICELPIFPTCDTNRVQDGSFCRDTNPNNHTSCGGAGQAICELPIFPTCDTNRVQDGSFCRDTNPNNHTSCGGSTQSICELPIFPTCDTSLAQRLSDDTCHSTDPNLVSSCGGVDQSICELPTFPTCDTNMTQVGSLCQDTNPNHHSSCGGSTQSICELPIFPTCDTDLAQRLDDNTCHSTNPNLVSSCGGIDQPICELPTFPTCDTDRVQEGSFCRDTNPNHHSNCGGSTQSICELPIFPTCDTDLAQRLDDNTCHSTNPNLVSGCGGLDQAICELPTFPTCDTNLTQVGSLCQETNPDNHSSCGGSTQSICTWPIFPTCDTDLAQRLDDNTCHNTDPNLISSCGGIDQPICELPTFPTCDTDRVQDGLFCQDKNPNHHSSCGGETQSICELPIFPTCDTGLSQEGNTCQNRNPNLHNSCGSDNQAICELPIFPTCDIDHFERDLKCFVHNPNLVDSCGGDMQAICELPIFPTCDTDIVQIGTSCFLPSECGAAGQRACTILPADASRRSDIGGRSCQVGTAEIPGLPDASLPSFGSSSQCAAVTACGGAGQRACCGGDEKNNFTGSCASGNIEIPDGILAEENNLCGGLNPYEDESSGMCTAVTACGGDGQRACCSGVGEFAEDTLFASCKSGLTESLGCTGNCTCGSYSADIKSNGTCISSNLDITEPTTNSTLPTTPRENSLSGYADLHIHLHANLAHGKNVLVGQPAPTDSMGKFLLDGSHNISTALSATTDKAIHGGHGLDDIIGMGTNDNAIGHMGVPYFNNWPNWRTSSHQQMYYKWLERAYRGGLRLTVLFAVTNEALCRSTAPAGVDIDARCANSMPAIDEQLTAARDFESFIDGQSGGVGQGWFRIVESPEDARRVISDGKLAVILGIEVDNIFNCKAKVIREELDSNGDVTKTVESGGCPDALLNGETEEEYITRSVNEYYALGVRHVFPVHNFDNAFGSPATWQNAINVGNRAVEGAYWQTEECPTTAGGSYGFKTPGDITDQVVSFLTSLFGFGVDDYIPNDLAINTTCHVSGLNIGQGDSVQILTNGGVPTSRVIFKHDTLGDFLFNRLMDKGMIIDVDHLSIKSVDNTINIARQRFPHYPLVASHVQFFDLNEESIRHERMRTREQLQAIRDDGGMIAAMLKDDQSDTDSTGKKFNTPYKWQVGDEVGDDCRHSSKTFAQMYQYSVDIMGGPVALGSDFNGMAGHVGPRFGSDACGGRTDALSDEYTDRAIEKVRQIRADDRLEYPFTLPKPGFDTLSEQVTGKKTFDFNVDGLAHVGLLPDMIKDMEIVGMDDHYFDALFNSAEQYVRVWERAEAISTGSPVADLNLTSTRLPADCVDIELCFNERYPGGSTETDPQNQGTAEDDESGGGGSISYWLLMVLGFIGLRKALNVRDLK